MKTSAVKLLAMVTALSVTQAFADNGTYAGISYHLGTYDESGFPEANPSGIKLEIGKYLAKNVAIEGHLLFGADSDQVTYLGANVDLELKNAISMFVKGDIPLSDTANIYGLLGFTKGKFEAATLGTTVSDSDSSLSYGIGTEIGLSSDTSLSGEYIFYISKSDYDYTGFNIGISKKF